MEGKVRWGVLFYKPVLEEMDGWYVCECEWVYVSVCGWVELSLVWCWLCMRWFSAGQMVLVGRWVNNDVSPQCSNYPLLGPLCSLCALHKRMHALINHIRLHTAHAHWHAHINTNISAIDDAVLSLSVLTECTQQLYFQAQCLKSIHLHT